MNSERDILLLDGDCGLCNKLAIFLDKRLGKGKDIAYRAILSHEGQELITTFPQKQQDADTVYLLRNGKSYIRSAAGIRCLLYMKWYYRMWFPVLWIIPFPLRDIGYRIIAKYRHKIFKKPDTCLFRID
ncbi:MAG: thiol-disulfide oxidoreductase DCC family protein [Candidatus Poseidoniaceae archaeon]